MKFPGIVEQAKVYGAPAQGRRRRRRHRLVPLRRHGTSSYGDALPYLENASRAARRAGARHRRDPRRPRAPRDPAALRHEQQTGKQVLLSEPLYWGMRVARMSTSTLAEGARPVAGRRHSRWRRSTTPTPCPRTPPSPAPSRPPTRRCSPTSTASSAPRTQAMSAATSRYEDTAAIDFINYVQADAVKKALAGHARGARCRCCRSPRRSTRLAAIPAGDVTVRDVAGLYIYDNTLLGIELTGAQVKAYLEYSARVLQAGARAPGPFAADAVTNAVTRRRRTAPPTTTTTSWAGSTPPDLRHRPRPAGRRPHHEPRVRRLPRSTADAGVRRRDQQLPPVRRRQLPGRDDRAGRLQRAGRDPPAAHRLGDRQQGHRPGGLRQRSTGSSSATASRSPSPADRHTAGASGSTPRLDGCDLRPLVTATVQPRRSATRGGTRPPSGAAPRLCTQELTRTW